MLTVETKRTTQEEERLNDRGFEHLGAPALSLIFKAATFGVGPAAVKELFKLNPFIFEGMNIPDANTFPNTKNRLVDIRLGEIAARLRTT